MFNQSVQVDPLDSPHPIPWNWVLATLEETNSDLQLDRQPSNAAANVHYYRSQSWLSPDLQYAAYSRIQMHVQREFYRSRVSSILFLENLETGDLQAITPTSPLADNPFLSDEAEADGKISIVIPVSWSETGDRLLARVFESLFGSDFASDYAVIIDRPLNQISTVAPTTIPHTHAILLGWSRSHPERVLFRAGNLGDPVWNQWTVDGSGNVSLAEGDRPITYGHASSSIWMGPQGGHRGR